MHFACALCASNDAVGNFRSGHALPNSAALFKLNRPPLRTIALMPANQSRRHEMTLRTRFGRRIHPSVQAELDAAAACDAQGRSGAAFGHLERAHVLGQADTLEHVRAHWAMLTWALRHNAAGEVWGQAWRLLGAALKTWVGRVPMGNTGGANVSGFKPMPVPADLQRLIDAARS